MNNIVDSVATLEEKIARVRAAQQKYSTYTQEQVDKIFLAAAIAAKQGGDELHRSPRGELLGAFAAGLDEQAHAFLALSGEEEEEILLLAFDAIA